MSARKEGPGTAQCEPRVLGRGASAWDLKQQVCDEMTFEALLSRAKGREVGCGKLSSLGEAGPRVCSGDSESGTCEEEPGGTEDMTVRARQHLSAAAPPSGGAGQVRATQ